MSKEKEELPAIFFPERMQYVELTSPIESAYHLIKEVAKKGIFQIEDHNKGNYSAAKRYADTYMQCEEAERSLRFIEDQLKSVKRKDGTTMFPKAPPYGSYLHSTKSVDLSDVLQHIHDDDVNLRDKVSIFQQLQAQLKQRKMKLKALQFYRPIVEKEHIEQERRTSEVAAVELEMLNEVQIVTSVTGFCPSESVRKMLTVIYRVSRRNIIYHLGEATNNDMIPYVIFASSATVLSKIQKICESFSPDVFDFPGDSVALATMERQLVDDIEQMEGVSKQTRQLNVQFLKGLARSFWKRKIYITQEKQIWQTLDFGDYSEGSSVTFRGWCPKRLMHELNPILAKATADSGSPIDIQMTVSTAEDRVKSATTEVVVPTFIEKNSFTTAFQMLNDAYGVPNYDELNGGAFYCIYPFLFAIMFGDIGHSIFYILAAIALLFLDPIAKRQRWNLGEMGGQIFKFKWLLFFAAFCSLYCGLIYDECFGLPISFFSSGWYFSEEASSDTVMRWEQRDDGFVYPFGIDYVWYFKDNELIFLNSYKMKLSVVVGMCQMVFGMFLQLVNHIYRKSLYDVLTKWLPEMLYLVPFFGYLVVIIIKKWTIRFRDNDQYIEDVQENGVNLIQVMIGMILNLGSSDDKTLELYPNCWNVQLIITIIFFVSLPYLLFVRPICECVIVKKEGREINILEIFVMNLIEVIEFCLGALSHTASYLRLWALSLAHSQLSHVIYDELFILTLNSNNVVLVFIGWAAFAALSAAILLAMEAFSALLHAIRLMWVEFSSKFYGGMGTAFKPLSLKKTLKAVGVF